MTAANERVVVSCRSCPGLYADEEANECHMDPLHEPIRNIWGEPPASCPLRQGPITLRLKEGV